MRKIKSGSIKIQHLRSALLRAGMTTYPLAMQAIAEFRSEVFSILERVAKRRAKAISRIVGNSTFTRDSEETDAFLDGTDTYLSVITNGACSFRIDVFWQDVDTHPEMRIAASIYCDKRATFEKVDRALQEKFGNKIVTDDRGCYLAESIGHQRAGQLESALGRISDRWIKMLRTVNVRKLIRETQ